MRIRPIGVALKIEAVIDDGENLIPIEIDPILLTPQKLLEFNLSDQLKELEKQIKPSQD